MIVNEDSILQRFSKAVTKNEGAPDVVEITRVLGGAITDWTRSWPGIRQTVPLLADVQPDEIPEQGLKIGDSEDSHDST